MALIHRDNGGYLGIDVRETADPWLDNVVLLLQPDAGDTTIVDKSPSAHSITNNGVTLDNTNEKWTGAPSLLFERANGDYLLCPDDDGFDLVNYDFTIEFWKYDGVGIDADDFYGFVAQRVDGSGGDLAGTRPVWDLHIDNRNNEGIRMIADDGIGGTAEFNTLEGSDRDDEGVWKHVAYTRQGDTFRIFVDGSVTALNTSTYNFGTSTAHLIVGARFDGYGHYDGNMTSIRITKGVARYTSNFTPPARPFPTRRYASGVFQP